ncbi:MAG: L-glutamate gamma-semialdehyde dehydrogenase [Flavobacteriales bacterium]|nr:L-glutamate gamma-semialdehyde dehydrogenase [Flavobacteriales bacterium]
MAHGTFQVPFPVNEPVRSYAPGSPEREELQDMYNKMYNQDPIDVPMYIGGEMVRTSDKRPMTPPHEHGKVLGYFNYGDSSHVVAAIDSALAARKRWAAFSFEERATIFLKAADLIAGKYRAKLNASTMLAQGKNCFQAEIDASCELIDFLRFNAYFAQEIQAVQPESSEGIWNRTEYRALEGFTFAVTPFNFTAIAANLPACMALMGNVVVWKPADTQMYSAQVLMEIFREAGVPDGVINLITVDGPVAGDVVFKHPDFSGLHFTGSTAVFRHLWKTIGENLELYKTYPRIVGETGGKDFVVAHSSANTKAVAAGLLRGSFEYQGQKCSAASRAYISDDIWPAVKDQLLTDLNTLKMGSPADFGNFINAVIDRRSFDKIKSYIEYAKSQDDCEIISGGGCDDSVGYFVEPTVILTSNPLFRTMVEEIFGPVLTIYVFPASEFTETLELVDSTSEYALTGGVFAQDRYALAQAKDALENAAGNFYLNDKPTGAVVGQQPFGGARGSGTNDKAGSALNLLRWVSARTVKETLVPVEDYRYPFHS